MQSSHQPSRSIIERLFSAAGQATILHASWIPPKCFCLLKISLRDEFGPKSFFCCLTQFEFVLLMDFKLRLPPDLMKHRSAVLVRVHLKLFPFDDPGFMLLVDHYRAFFHNSGLQLMTSAVTWSKLKTFEIQNLEPNKSSQIFSDRPPNIEMTA